MRNLLFLAVSATLGVTAFSFFGWKVSFCIILFLSFVYYKNGCRTVILQVVAIALFFASAFITDHYRTTSYAGTETSFSSITFKERPDIDGNILRAEVRSDADEKLQLRYIIPTLDEKHLLEKKLAVGLACPVKGSLEEPETRRNLNSFDYRGYLNQQGIYWILNAESFAFQDCFLKTGNPLQSIKKIRSAGISYIEKHFPEETKGYVSALLFGEQKEIHEDELAVFQQLGLVHLLAISGLHVSFLTGILFYAGIRLGVTREMMSLSMLVFLPIYVILSGASISVWRACLIAMIFFSLLLLKKQISITKSMIIVYLTLLFLQPYMLLNIGFQLSFAAAFSIIMSSPILSRFKSRAVQLFIVSFICQMSTLPILLFHFHEVTILGVFLNILFVPLYSLLLPFSIVAFLMHIVYPPAGDFFIYILNLIITVSNAMAGFVSTMPLASVAFGKPAFFLILMLVTGILSFFICWDLSAVKAVKYLSAGLALLLVFQLYIEKLNPFGEVVFIDIGQGDAIFIKLPFDKGNYLIDTGGRLMFKQEAWKQRRSSFNTGKDIVVPFLKSKGIDRLDKLILTHPDVDHIGGVKEVIEEIDVVEIVIGRGSERDYFREKFVDTSKAEKIAFKAVKRGDLWKAGEATFYIVNPYREEEDKNEASIVMYAEFGGQRWMFTGDLGVDGEEEIVKVFPNLRADVLKAGHHGSKTSTSESFLDLLQPRIAIISAGKENRYGHPHAEVMEALQERKIQTYRTDKDGAVSYRFINRSGTFSSVLP